MKIIRMGRSFKNFGIDCFTFLNFLILTNQQLLSLQSQCKLFYYIKNNKNNDKNKNNDNNNDNNDNKYRNNKCNNDRSRLIHVNK